MVRVRLLLLPVLILCAFCVSGAAAGEVKALAPAGGQDPEITERVEKAVEKACQWLARNQNKDGSMKSSYTCAATALAGLAWMATGSTPYEGPYARNISSALDYILRNSAKSGFISENGGYGPSGMYGHGYGTQFLAQAHGMIRDEALAGRVKDALARAVRSIEGCQNQYGGWNSSPNGALNDDGSGAIAVMQVTALRAAESCGVQVKSQVIERAKKYLLAMTSENGSYAYNWHARGSGQGTPATTGAGMYMLGALGLYTDPKYKKGINNLMSRLPTRGNESSFGGWYPYAVFYASLAIFQHGGAEWSKWYAAMSDSLVQSQSPDGGWDDSYGGVFVALSVMSLELPYRYLPMFQEGAAGMEGR
ncbi:MAG: terpene cyclase/mutase family protein [Planctomycetota bacterium]|nr:terpene cyclase/mutase family protein [Planctomycetota bacterium]